ncbi:hypothetical protein ASE75_02160 [Sphingomonas sp. Leaf17]|uniref:ImuA family protein n=1 Tax=Sphingomonas sp. Leaf17 TaxID=1735683 RepID=UPI0006FD2AE9|nr:hypothetical protein [Sphingomonas sp. Leaf17]KQM67738.1 hypothetical protein ASE75_02160 [Sphingomonas sp. Leaf17]
MSSRTLAALQAALGDLTRDGFSRRPEMPFGVADVDSRLADDGLRLDALHEVTAATPTLDDEIATTLFLAGLAARCWGPVLWIASRQDLFAPDPTAVGLAPGRLIRVAASDDADVARLMEAGLLHRGLGAVIGEAARIGPAALARVCVAAAGGQTIALLHRRHGSDDPLVAPSPARTRWRVGAMRAPRPGRARWTLDCAHQVDGPPFTASVRACDETGRLAGLPRAVDRVPTVRECHREAA